jgi:hypothetical protein
VPSWLVGGLMGPYHVAIVLDCMEGRSSGVIVAAEFLSTGFRAYSSDDDVIGDAGAGGCRWGGAEAGAALTPLECVYTAIVRFNVFKAGQIFSGKVVPPESASCDHDHDHHDHNHPPVEESLITPIRSLPLCRATSTRQSPKGAELRALVAV